MKNVIKNFLTKIPYGRVHFGFKIVFPDNDYFVYDKYPVIVSIYFKNEKSMREFIKKGGMGFAESYMSQDIDIEGDFYYLAFLGHLLERQGVRPNFWEGLKILYYFLTHRNTKRNSKNHISYHYDLGNDFYSLWLDKNMQYTCAYFESPEDSLEKAQVQKMDLVCRKLMLKHGENIVEAGCGWGGFAIYAAKNYGVNVRAYNISEQQIYYAREWAKREGLSNQVEFILDDYREIKNDKQTYDKFVSIGMLEHVGVENYQVLLDIIYNKIKEEGIALIHSISRAYPRTQDPWVNKYIFPGGYIPSLGEFVVQLENYVRKFSNPHYFFIMDIENLKYHYALTLDHWSQRYEQNIDEIRKKYGEAFVRMFRMYLRGSSSAFRIGELTLLQIVLTKEVNSSYPLTRKHLLQNSVIQR